MTVWQWKKTYLIFNFGLDLSEDISNRDVCQIWRYNAQKVAYKNYDRIAELPILTETSDRILLSTPST